MSGSMKLAYTAVINDKGEYRLAIAKWGEAGYYGIKDDSDAGGTFDSLAEARTAADAYNERLGLSPLDALKIVWDTIRLQNINDAHKRSV